MKIKILISSLILFFSLISFCDNNDIITQGEFALLLVKHTATPPPPGGWTIESAIALLTEVQVLPYSGVWESSKELIEFDLAFVMSQIGLPLYAVNPDEKVTRGRANAIFFRYDDYIKNYNLKTRTVYQTYTTHIDTAVGGTDTLSPASPTVP